MKTMIKPTRLKKGDTIAIVSPSWGGAHQYPQPVEWGIRQIRERFGYHVIFSPHARETPEKLLEHPELRARDLHWAHENPAVDGIFSAIGGDDSIRVIPFLDPEVLRRNPKIFLGYSDTTSIHLFYQKHGLVTFYGPSIMSGFASKGGLERYTEDALRCMIEGGAFPLQLEPNSTGVPAETLNWDDYRDEAVAPARVDERPWVFRQGRGLHEGRSIGGCFEILSLMANGTSIWPSHAEWEGGILLLEISFEMARSDFVTWFFRSLQAQGILKRLNGIIFGKNHWRQVPAELDEKIGAALHKMIQVECNLPDLPIITGVHFGHICPAMTLPLGVRMEIDCDSQIIRVLESPVI